MLRAESEEPVFWGVEVEFFSGSSVDFELHLPNVRRPYGAGAGYEGTPLGVKGF